MANDGQDIKPQTVTMRDVARLANVSQSTVSRILGSTQSTVPISEETRNKVLAVRLLWFCQRASKSFMRQAGAHFQVRGQ